MSKENRETPLPPDLRKALTNKPNLMILWKDLTPIAQRDFIAWIQGAKQPETRERRIGITCDKLATGKRRPCCYAVVPMNLYKALRANPKAKITWSNLTPMERRDIVGQIEKVADKEKRGIKIDKIITKLVSVDL